MKTQKMPGFGNYGQIIDDLDFADCSAEQWSEIGKSHLKQLVTVIRNPKNLDQDEFLRRIAMFGIEKNTMHILNRKKEGRPVKDFGYGGFQKEKTAQGNLIHRVTGAKDENGNMLGAFGCGDLGWHSNEGGQLTFAPEVALLANHKMKGSATSFMQTADFYETASESLRSELDNMILVHAYKPGAICETEKEDSNFGYSVRMNFCPTDGLETPLVITSPGGTKGLHFPVNSASHIKGVSKEESDKIFAMLHRELFVEKYMYEHWYEHDNDFVLFDNSITLHNRIGGEPDRKMYRIQYEPTHLLDGPWYPYSQQEYHEVYVKQNQEIMEYLGETTYKMPLLDRS